MQRALMCSLAAAVSAWTTIAAAEPPRLKGDYAVTGTFACLYAPGSGPVTPGVAHANAGFNANLTPIDAATTFYNSASLQGIWHLDGNGHGTLKTTTITVGPLPSASASESTSTGSFTYIVHPDGSWAVAFVSFVGTTVVGPLAGQTTTVTNISQAGVISDDGKVLTLSSLDPVIEVATSSGGSVTPRVCHRSHVLIKVGGSDDGDHDRR